MTNSVYHPILNSNGTYKASDNKFWYETTVALNSVADCFTPTNIGTINGRPDSKSDKYVYAENMIDVREYAKILNHYEVDLIRDDKEDNGVEEVTIGFAQALTPIQKGLDSNQVFIELGVSNNFTTYGDNAIWSTTTIPNYNIVLIDASGVIHKDCFAGFSVNGRYLHWVEGFTDTSIIDIVGTCYIGAIKTKPILTSNTKLSIDLIGSPTNYPQILKDRLASGVGIVGINPLLVGQDGTSYTLVGDGTYDWIIGKKSLSTTIPLLYSLSNGEDWALHTKTVNTITNNITGTISSGWLSLISYTSKNHPYIQTTPKAVIEVEPKVIASNSHSIYKGALVGNQVAGKIQVGNGANGYESKVLENSERNKIDHKTNGTFTIKPQETILVTDDYTGDDIVGAVYRLIDTASSTKDWTTYSNFNLTAYWKLESVLTIPRHPTIALDNANSPASKWFEVLEEGNNGVLAGVYGEELVYNGATTSFDGDDETFEQLTNGSIIDLNGQVCRTFKGSIALNGKVK